MAAKNWGVFLCNCRKTLTVEAERMGDPAALLTVATHPEKALPAFAKQADKQDLDHMLIGCCASQDIFEKALGGRRLHFVDLKEKCFAPHADPEQAHGKALQMIKAAMGAAEVRGEVKQNLLQAGGRVMLFTDTPVGLDLAKQLKKLEQLTVFVSPEAQGFEKGSKSKVNLGWLASLEGRLGNFRVTVERPQLVDGPARKPLQEQADQVVLLMEGPLPEVKRRSGVHLVQGTDRETLKRTSQEVWDLVGLFQKPEHLVYDKEICAGGTAGMQACGRCISYCPYDAIARNPANTMRVLVDHMTCEGCGACVSACPTSALRFTDPSPREIYTQLAALLAAPGRRKKQKLPPVITFYCGEMGSRTLAAAGEGALPYSPAVLPVEVPCLRYVSDANMLQAFRMGAAGVVLLGCEDCPNGERELLYQQHDFAQGVLEAFGIGKERLRIITAEPGGEAQAIDALDRFARKLKPSPFPGQGKPPRRTGNREILAEAIGGFISMTGKEAGGIKLAESQPFGFVEVRDEGCTLCRSCANVCPTHAFKFDEQEQSLHFKHINCVGCGMCVKACPENVMQLRPELILEQQGLDYIKVVEDEMITCARCEAPYINRRALEAIESKVLGLESLLDTFAGKRKKILRMCPDCRAVAAMWDVDQGIWEP
ncbi:MAG: 4Fe-4S dicluster domain-containing protein [SAR324 cluster bacterium]|nr:4Fe-4S dicluster domain-containing protein [SAR324 cluster bacterium]